MIDVSSLTQDVIDGNENPLKGYAILKQLQKQVANAISEIEEYALDEASKFGEKTFETMNYKFELREGGRRYDFKSIPQWVDANSKLKDIESTCKQAALAYEKGKNIVDENGEVVPVPVVKFSKSSITVKPL